MIRGGADFPKDPRALRLIEQELQIGNLGPIPPIFIPAKPRYLVTYMNSQTSGRSRSATVVTVTNQSSSSCRVAVSYFKGFNSNANPACSTSFAITPDFTVDFCSRNLPGELRTILAHCLAHARRRFVDVHDRFPEPCRHLLETLAVVYRNDAVARERGLSPEARLRFHQESSRPTMEQLREVTDESVRLWAPDGDRIVLLENMDSRQAVRSVLQPGGTVVPMHASAAGKAMLAALPDEEVDVFLARPLAAVAPKTITDPDELRAQLRTIRRRGWAETYHEASKDVGAVAAAIHDPTGRPIAAIALALPMHRLTETITKRYGKAVAEATEELSRQLA